MSTELALVVVLALAGANASAALATRIALAVIGPAAAVVIWGIGIAPMARRRWPDPWRMAVEVLLFGAASAALAMSPLPITGIFTAAFTSAILVQSARPL